LHLVFKGMHDADLLLLMLLLHVIDKLLFLIDIYANF
jgi:hypothetical protein